MIHPLNLVGGYFEIQTRDGRRRISTRRYRIGKSSPFTQHVGKIVRLIANGPNENPYELLATMVQCALETELFDNQPYMMSNVILSALSEIEPIAPDSDRFK